MSMVATSIATVPTTGFKWYIVLLEGPFADEIKNQINKYFTTLGKEVGPDILAVRGYDPTNFKNSFIESAAFYGEGDWKNVEVPALVVTDALPIAVETPGGLDNARVMLFPLRPVYEKHKDISVFFGQLIAALHSGAGVEALAGLDESKVEKWREWISEYPEMKPRLFGFNVVNFFFNGAQQVNQSGAVNLLSEGDLNISGDVTGRDKLEGA